MLAFDDHGAGDPIVLLHGLAASREIWTRVVPQLAERHRVLAVDVPGFGQSVAAGDDFALEAVAQSIWDGLPEDLGPATVIGHSMGGAIALTAAALAPERVARLVLCAPAGLLPAPVPAWLLGPAGALWEVAVQVRNRMEPFAGHPLARRFLLGTSTAPAAELTAEDVRLVIGASGDQRSTAAALRAIAHADLRDELAALPRPVGLLWGTSDMVVPTRALDAGIAARPGIAVERMQGVGHLPMIERPGAFLDALESLLTRLDAS